MIALKKSVTVFKNNSGEKSLRWLQDSVEYSIELKSVLSLMDDAENIATTSTSPKTTLIIVAPTTNNSASFSATVVFDVAKKQAIFVNSETNKQLFTIPMALLEEEQKNRRKQHDQLSFVVDTSPDFVPARVSDTNLFVGAFDATTHSETLRRLSIKHVLNVGVYDSSQQQAVRENDVRYLHVPLLDEADQSLTDEVLLKCLHFIDEAMNNANECCLVHCNAGVSRSATIVLCWMLQNDIASTLDEALAIVRRTRPSAKPNDGFMKQLRQREKKR